MRKKDGKRPRREPPVKTEHDGRARERSGAGRGKGGRASAPDGISGDWG